MIDSISLLKNPILYICFQNDFNYKFYKSSRWIKIKKVYIDSRCKTNGSVSNNHFKFE